MIEAARRRRTQPPPPRVVFRALVDPYRDPYRPWLDLFEGERPPRVLQQEEPDLVICSSLWLVRPDAQVRFDLLPDGRGSGTDLQWTLLLSAELADDALVRQVWKRLNQLINADLRFSFGQ